MDISYDRALSCTHAFYTRIYLHVEYLHAHAEYTIDQVSFVEFALYFGRKIRADFR